MNSILRIQAEGFKRELLKYSVSNILHRYKKSFEKEVDLLSMARREIKIRDFTRDEERFDLSKVYLQEIKTMDYYLKKKEFEQLPSMLEEHEKQELIRIINKYLPFVKINEVEYNSYIEMLNILNDEDDF